jgi:uncharacterized protein YndB with AHSA1/START domain
METIAIERSIWINAPREHVWQAITAAEQIRQWWGDDHWEIEHLEVGGLVKFGDPDDLMTAIIDVLDPPREFTLQWPPQEQYYSIPMITTFLLEEENGGTRVTVRETGFEGLPDEVRQERIDQTAESYVTVLVSLKDFIERAES